MSVFCLIGAVYATDTSTDVASGNVSNNSIEHAPSIEWFKTYGQIADDQALIAIRIPGGSFIVGGATESSDQSIDDSWIKKISAKGDTEWTQNYESITLDEVRSICTLPSGDFIMAGGVEPAGEHESEDAAVIKVDAMGNLIWNMSYGRLDRDETARSVILKKDGGLLIVGKTSSENEASSDALILSLTAEGTTEWFRVIGSGSAIDAQSVVEVADGYVLAGYKAMGNGDYDAWVCKIDLIGQVVWEKTYGGPLLDSAHEIVSDTGGFIVTGEKKSGSAGGSDLWVFKLSETGDLIWEEVYGGALDDKGFSITRTADSGFLIAGMTQSYGAGMTDAWIVKLAPDGTPEWSKTVGGPDEDIGSYAIEIEGKNIITCGMTKSYGAGMYDAMVAELGW